MLMLGMSLLLLGAALLLVAAVGLFLLKDSLSRQHAATKAGTLALGLIVIGAAIYNHTLDGYLRCSLVLIVLFVTLPVASHMLARAAMKEKKKTEPQENLPCF